VTTGDRLVVDAARCDGHGICVLRCPELVRLDRWGFAGVDPAPIDDARLARRALRAVAACPNGALSVVTGERGGAPRTGPGVTWSPPPRELPSAPVSRSSVPAGGAASEGERVPWTPWARPAGHNRGHAGG